MQTGKSVIDHTWNNPTASNGSNSVNGIEFEVLVGILTAVTLLLACLVFVSIMLILYHRKAKSASSPSGIGTPEGATFNLKGLLGHSPSNPSAIYAGTGPNASAADLKVFPAADSRALLTHPPPVNENSRWQSVASFDCPVVYQHPQLTSGHYLPPPPPPAPLPKTAAVGVGITANPLATEYACVDLPALGSQPSPQSLASVRYAC